MTPEEWASRIMAAWQKASSEDELDLETRIARALTQARAEALQEAARVAEEYQMTGFGSFRVAIAAAIRSLPGAQT